MAAMDRPVATLWRHTDFLKLWAGQTISVFGSQFTMLALPLIAALTLHASPFEMGVLSALETAPFLLVGLFAGVFADRRRRRPILIVADIGRGLTLASIPVAWLLGSLTLPHLFAVGFLVGLCTVFFDVSYQSYLPSLVGRDKLVEGNSKLTVSESATQIAGPGIAGVVVQALSAPIAIVVDALSFFASALALGSIRHVEPQPTAARKSVLSDLREGLATVFGDRYLRAIAACTSTANFFGAGVNALYVIFATRELGLNAAQLGIVFGAGAVTSLFGALLAGPAARRLGLGRAIVLSSACFGLAYVPLIFAVPELAMPVLILGGAIIGLANPIYNINQVSLRQTITPERLLGRMNATMRFLVWGTMPIGALTGGALGGLIGLRPAIAVATVGCFLAFVWVWRSPVWSLREMPDLSQQRAG